MSAVGGRPPVEAEPEIEQCQIRILIADDHPLMIVGIRRMIDRLENTEVVGEARTGLELLQLIERRRPGLVLTDLSMPGFAGTECLEQIRARWPEMKIIVLSARDDRASIDSALRAGANAYVVKSASPVEIASVVRQVASGAVLRAAPRSRRPLPSGDQVANPWLTDRERSILSAVAAGQTTAAISREMWVSEHTIKFHLTNIYRKLDVSNRAGAVRYAFEHDLVTA